MCEGGWQKVLLLCPFSLSPSCLGVCLHRKLLRRLSFIVLRSTPRDWSPRLPLPVLLSVSNCTGLLWFLLCLHLGFYSLSSWFLLFCVILHHYVLFCFCFFLIIYPYSMCLSPCVFLFFPLGSHSLPSCHILSRSSSLCLFSVSLFIQPILRLSVSKVSNPYPPREWK